MRTGEFEVEGGGRYLMYPLPSFCNKNAIHITLRGPSLFFHDLKYPLPTMVSFQQKDEKILNLLEIW
jgi:hypothetical protein